MADILFRKTIVAVILYFSAIISYQEVEAVACTNQSMVTIINPPQDTYAGNGTHVTLTCIFSHPVKCNWKFNDVNLKNSKEGQFSESCTTDCSLVIASMTSSDVGIYQCQSLSGDIHNTSSTATAILNMTQNHETSISQHPKSRAVQTGATVKLRCEFDWPVDCVWRRRNHRIRMMKNNYEFISGSTGMDTTDCTMSILDFQSIDAGPWTCSSMANSHGHSVSSRPAWLQDAMSTTWLIIGIAVIGIVALLSTICFFKWISHLRKYPNCRTTQNQLPDKRQL